MRKPIPRVMKVLKDAPPDAGGYHNFVSSFDEDHYRKRVEMVDFVGAERVLDAGCGMGQWAVQLARENHSVIGVDHKDYMVEASRMLAKACRVSNVEFKLGKLPHLEFSDKQFDLIWCWGVLMEVNREQTLAEFNRLLRLGGRLLCGCVNARGRWLYKAFSSLNPLKPRWKKLRMSLRALLRGHELRARPNYTSIKACKEFCERFGFELIAADFDGHIDLTGRSRRAPMFSRRFLFWENNIEFLARKVRDLDWQSLGERKRA